MGLIRVKKNIAIACLLCASHGRRRSRPIAVRVDVGDLGDVAVHVDVGDLGDVAVHVGVDVAGTSPCASI